MVFRKILKIFLHYINNLNYYLNHNPLIYKKIFEKKTSISLKSFPYFYLYISHSSPKYPLIPWESFIIAASFSSPLSSLLLFPKNSLNIYWFFKNFFFIFLKIGTVFVLVALLSRVIIINFPLIKHCMLY